MDPRIIQQLIAAVDERVRQLFAAKPYTRYGVVDAVDTANLKVSVFLGADTTSSGGFRYPGWLRPSSGDRVRVVVDPNGDRYVDEVYATTPVLNGMLAAAAIRLERITSDVAIATSTQTTMVYNGIIREDDPLGILSANTGTGVVTVSRSGWYFMDASIGWGAGSTGDRQISIQINGTSYATQRNAASANVNRTHCSTVKYLTAGDAVSVAGTQTNGSNVNFQAGTDSFFSVVYLGL